MFHFRPNIPHITYYHPQKQQLVMEECAKLAQYVESHTADDTNGKRPEKMAATQLLTFLGQSFSSLVDIALGILIQVGYGPLCLIY